MSVEFTDNDLDRLADFAAGLLDDPAAGAVAQLIRTVPSWAAAYAGLVEANDVVTAQLRAHARTQLEPMPGDVAATVTAALAEASRASVRRPGGEHARHQAPAPRRAPAISHPAEGRSIGAQPTAGRSVGAHRTTDPAVLTRTGLASVSSLDSARRRKRRLFAGVTTAAAAVVAITAGLTISGGLLTGPNQSSTTANRGSAADQMAAGKGSATAPELSTVTVYLVTGTNYRQDTLAAKVTSSAPVHPFGTSPVPAVPDGGPPQDLHGRVPPELIRLTEPVALTQCLVTISAAHPGVPVSVDYARFNDQPALVIVVRSPAATTVVAVGPQCGVAGANELAAAPA